MPSYLLRHFLTTHHLWRTVVPAVAPGVSLRNSQKLRSGTQQTVWRLILAVAEAKAMQVPLPSDSLLARILACGDGLAATMNSDGEG
jgi:hypothetical protein